MARQEPSRITQIFLLTSAVAIVNTGFGIIFPVFPKFLEIIGDGDAFDLGNMAAMFGVTYLIFAPVFGNLADRVGKKKIILFGLVGFILSNFLYVLAQDITLLYVARATEGIFASAVFPPALALVTELAPEDKTAKYIGYLSAGQTTGIIVGPLLGGVLLDGFSIANYTLEGSLYLPFYVSIAIGLLALIFSFIYIHPRPPTIRQLNENLSKRVGISQILRDQIRVIPKPFLAFFVFILVDIGSISPWLLIEPGFVFYFYDELLLTPTDFGLWVGIFAVTAVLGNVFLGQISDKYGRKPVILVGQLFSTAFYILLPFATDFITLSLIVILVGIGSGLREPAMKALLTDVTDPEYRATIFGIEAGLMSTSQIISPILGGYIYVTQGVSLIFMIATAIALLNIILIPLILFRPRKNFVDDIADTEKLITI